MNFVKKIAEKFRLFLHQLDYRKQIGVDSVGNRYFLDGKRRYISYHNNDDDPKSIEPFWYVKL